MSSHGGDGGSGHVTTGQPHVRLETICAGEILPSEVAPGLPSTLQPTRPASLAQPSHPVRLPSEARAHVDPNVSPACPYTTMPCRGAASTALV